MDWLGFLASGILGAVLGIIFQNLLFPSLQAKWQRRRRKRYFKTANATWRVLEELHPRLTLVQGGWDERGCFSEGSITLTLADDNYIAPPEVLELEREHGPQWLQQGLTNGQQIGIASITIQRITDSPTEEIAGLAHSITIDAHQYQYFDYLATHQMLVRGEQHERVMVGRLAGLPDATKEIPEFPNPCSVGLSLLCEAGTQLVLPRRSGRVSTGGYWEALKIYNAVGENAAHRDFKSVPGGPNRTTPIVVAQRASGQ